MLSWTKIGQCQKPKAVAVVRLLVNAMRGAGGLKVEHAIIQCAAELRITERRARSLHKDEDERVVPLREWGAIRKMAIPALRIWAKKLRAKADQLDRRADELEFEETLARVWETDECAYAVSVTGACVEPPGSVGGGLA